MDGRQAGPGLQEGKTPLKSPRLATVLLSRVPGCLVSGVQEGQQERGARAQPHPGVSFPATAGQRVCCGKPGIVDRQPPQGQE